MGLGPNWSSSSYDKKEPKCEVTVVLPQQLATGLPNPNPKNYRILRSEQIGRWLVVEVLYPDCTNYEGRKILVFRDATLGQLQSQGHIDPHFAESKEWLSPFARFEPTAKGWRAALSLADLHDTIEELARR